MKKLFENLIDIVLYLPRLFKFLKATVKSILYIRKKLIINKLLSKKQASKLVAEAFETSFKKNFEDYADCDMYGDIVYRLNALDWIRRYGNQGAEIDAFCDQEVSHIDNEINDGDLTYDISAADYNLLTLQISQYQELLDEINTPIDSTIILH